MFKEVSLEVKSRNDLLDAAKRHGAAVSIADCQPLDRKRMVMLLDLVGTPAAVEETIDALGKMVGVEHAYEVESNVPGTRVLVALEKPGVCRASAGDALLCLDCPFISIEVPARWRFVARRGTEVGRIVERLAQEGVQARIEGVSPLGGGAALTEKDRGVIAAAIEKGYFDFPRKVTLEGLSQLLGVETADLSKILRSVE